MVRNTRWWKPASRLTERCLVYHWATKSAYKNQTKKISAAQQGSSHDNAMNERMRQPSTRKKKGKYTDIFKLFLHRGINAMQEFSCTHNTICTHVTCMVVMLHAFCEGLITPLFFKFNSAKIWLYLTKKCLNLQVQINIYLLWIYCHQIVTF